MSNTKAHILINGSTFDFETLKDRQDFASEFEREVFAFAADFLDPDTDEITVQTSGSTGTPKSITLEKEKMRNSARMTAEYFKLTQGKNALLCLSPGYIAGKMMIVRAIEAGLNLVLGDNASNPVKSLSTYQIIHFAAMVPMQVQACFQDGESADKLAKIESIIVGGGAVSHSLLQRIKTLPNKLYATYGMTETITHVAVRPLNGEHASDIYTSLKGVKIWQDDRGCLLINAPQLVDEQVVTNDVIEMEDFTQFRWLGRIDNVINSGGIKLFPEQIEKQLEETLDRRFFCAGIPDETLGERLELIIEGEALDSTTHGLLENFMRQTLDKYQVPKAIKYVASFAETPTGKVQRRKTLELINA